MTPARHAPIDPPHLHGIATWHGRMVVGGHTTYTQASADLSRGLSNDRCMRGRTDFADVEARLFRTMDRIVYAEELAAHRDIVVGLAAMLDARKPIADIRRAAYRLAECRLTRDECDAIVRDQVARRMRPRGNA